MGDCHRNAVLSYVAAVVLASSETEEAYIHDGCQNSCACSGDSWWTSYEHCLSSDRGCIKALLWDRYKNICPVFGNVYCNDSEGCDILCTKKAAVMVYKQPDSSRARG